MKVNRAKHLLSRDISAALEFLADENTASEYFATAFFIKTVARWFCFMTSRPPNFSSKQTQEPEVRRDDLIFTTDDWIISKFKSFKEA